MIVFSQALSPNIDMLNEKINSERSVWITTVTCQSPRIDRKQRREKWSSNGAKFITYEEEYPDNTLVRVLGPIAGFIAGFYFSSFVK